MTSAGLNRPYKRFVPAREVELRDLCVQALRDAIEHSHAHRPSQLKASLAQSRCLIRELDELHALALGIAVVELFPAA